MFNLVATKQKILLVLFIVLFSNISLSYAETVWGRVYVDCGEYLDYIERDNDLNVDLSIMWLEGYITGMNDTKDEPVYYNAAGLKYAVENYCRDNPMNDFLDAARHVYINLLPD